MKTARSREQRFDYMSIANHSFLKIWKKTLCLNVNLALAMK